MHQFGNVVGKAADMGLAAAVGHRQRAVLDDVKHRGWQVDNLAWRSYLGLLQRQCAVATDD